ncbi:hypothetical protein M426DRAFT_7434 [Hypoxylon sp. CI-4A]|nr:hypothetical protein M426DRAFT_7434 [Hypoxylon sp. CI-4A]
MDKKLALAIFSIIAAKDTKEETLPLERLNIQYISIDDCGSKQELPLEFGQYMTALGRSWCVQREIRDDTRDRAFASLNREDNVRLQERFSQQDSVSLNTLTARVEPIFRRIWPARYPGSDWRNDWHSLPLDLTPLPF